MRFVVLFLAIVISMGIQEECEPVKVKAYIDIRLDAYARQQSLQIIKIYTDLLPQVSEVDLTVVDGQSLDHVGTFTLPNPKETLLAELSAKLNSFLLLKSSDPEVKISSKILEHDIISYFGFGKFKTKAEFVLLFVSSSTKLHKLPNFLQKKKTLVVDFGNDPNPDWKAVATDMDHYFHVSNGGNVDIIIERLIDVTCKDSKFTCDTDEFSTSKGSLCQKCVEYFCKRIDSLTCAHRCPYYRKPAADSQIRINSATNSSNLERSADHKPVALTVVFILGVIVAPLTVLLIYKTFDDRQTVIHHDIEMVDLSQRNTNQESRDLEENRVLIPDSSPQLGPSGATGGHQEQGPTDEEMVDQPDLSPRNTSEESRNLKENRVLIPDSSPQQGPSGATRGHPEPRPLDEEPLLKNGRELEINIIAFDDPSFRDIQEGKRAVVIRPANSED